MMKGSLQALFILQGGAVDPGNNASGEPKNQKLKRPKIVEVPKFDVIIIIATQGRVVYGERRHAEPPGGNDHPQLSQRLG
jgi:hypothetical protein